MIRWNKTFIYLLGCFKILPDKHAKKPKTGAAVFNHLCSRLFFTGCHFTAGKSTLGEIPMVYDHW